MMHTNRLLANFVPSFNFSSSSASGRLRIQDILKQARVFSNADVVEYAKLSCDSNPLHLDSDGAQNAGFGDRIVHGMLVASLFPRIIASHFPGAVYVSQSLHFRLPVYIGEEVTGTVQATNVRKMKNKYIVKFSTNCFKCNDQIVIDGEATAILPTLERENFVAE